MVKEAEKALGRRIDYFVPNEYKTVNAAWNDGVRRSEIIRGRKVEKRIDAVFASVLKEVRRNGEHGPTLVLSAD